MSSLSSLVRCIYCDRDVTKDELTDEHIWPDALGGDALPKFWRTEVCGSCNSMSGVFVDGAFIKSWIGAAERALSEDAYLATTTPERSIVPFSFIGTLPNIGAVDGEIVDYWVGRCGSSVLHFRPEGEANLWKSYSGGDPRKGSKRKTAGRAYLAITSPSSFWQTVALSSFRAQFKKAQRFCCTVLDPLVASDIPIPNENDPIQKNDIAVLGRVLSGHEIRTEAAIDLALGTRFQAKLGLALGYQLFGEAFGKTGYSMALRAAFREANPAKRTSSIVRGTGILSPDGLGGTEGMMRWSGGWLLWVKRQEADTVLTVISPSAKVMTVVLNDEATLTQSLGSEYDDGIVWVTVPSIEEASGPIPAQDYIAHMIGGYQHPELSGIKSKLAEGAVLPDCGLVRNPEKPRTQ